MHRQLRRVFSHIRSFSLGSRQNDSGCNGLPHKCFVVWQHPIHTHLTQTTYSVQTNCSFILSHFNYLENLLLPIAH
ncbi:hypothetical protein C6A33_08215 [Streptococcus anginosus]|nr:hypothetical protein C6A33_08215 [Streptococcus anginosus]